MEAVFYPVITIEDEEELEVLTGYCEEHKIEFQFLDDDLNSFPTQVLLYIDKEDFKLFLEGFDEDYKV
jgi:hypothetical protein